MDSRNMCSSTAYMDWDTEMNKHIFGLKVIKPCSVLFIMFLGKEMKTWHTKAS